MTLRPMPRTSYTDMDEMVNRLIELSGFDLFEGVGLYIDGQWPPAASSQQAATGAAIFKRVTNIRQKKRKIR